MSGWFSKTSSVFRRAAPEAEHPFQLACECGQVHRGLRRSRQLKLVCRECGATKFVLPRDVYPPPREARQEAAPPPSLPILKPIENEPKNETAAPAKKERLRRPENKNEEAKNKEPELLVFSAKPKFWTPFRFVALGISLTCILIVYVLVRKQQRDYATQVLRTAGDEAAMSMAAGDWVAARERYSAAVNAVDTLGRDDEIARRYRQGLREMTVLTSLSNGSLLDLLNDAEKHADDSEAWNKRFAANYRDQWLVFETPIRRGADENGVDRWEIDFPLPIGKAFRSVNVLADLNVFSRLKRVSSDQPVIFAAQLESCKLSTNRESWNVVLRPETGFLWALPSTYLGLGFSFTEWHPRDAVVQILKSQAALAEIEIEAKE